MSEISWSSLADWWEGEVANDPAYENLVTPLLLRILDPEAGKSYLDLGSGEGRVIRSVSRTGATVHGVEINRQLARRSALAGPTMIGSLPDLDFIVENAYDGAYCVLVIEHIGEHERFFAETARVVTPGGVLALVANHPTWTAPDSTPITDTDGEVLWRPGAYFSTGVVHEHAGEGHIVFHHRTMAELMNSARAAGWCLDEMIEVPDPDLIEQSGIPRLIACRWRLGVGNEA
ncbi:MAG: methyltransferase domain-containing protein [Acidimicrobiia bacterium]